MRRETTSCLFSLTTRWVGHYIVPGLEDQFEMQLKLAIHRITAVRFGNRTSVDGTTLVVAAEELRRSVLQESSLSGVNLKSFSQEKVAAPGRFSTSSSHERKKLDQVRIFRAF